MFTIIFILLLHLYQKEHYHNDLNDDVIWEIDYEKSFHD